MKPMTANEAAWVRDHAWAESIRASYANLPLYYTTCSCSVALLGPCADSQHHRCGRGVTEPQFETLITNSSAQPLSLARPYAHPTIAAIGSYRSTLAMVWLADRVCRCVCACDCHSSADGPPSGPEPETYEYEPVTLFDLVEAS